MLNWIDIDGDALRHNYSTFSQLMGNKIVAPVLKSNAYGHGLHQVYKALAPLNPAWICTNYIFEAEELRGLGYNGRILIVGPVFTEDLERAVVCRADIQIENELVLKVWGAMPDRPKAHFKFDTGMSRLGFHPSDADRIAREIVIYKNDVAGIYTHLANVEDVTEHDYADSQLERFLHVCDAFNNHNLTPLLHAASSASALLLENSRFDMVRLGISLYGLWPSKATRLSYIQAFNNSLELKPALSWKTRVATVKSVPKGDFIGYGCTYRATHKMRIAVLPIGYFEGYPRIAGNQPSFVLIRGQRCPLVGRICMNMMMVDITHVESIEIGDQVTLLGVDGHDKISAGDIGNWSHTIHYEIVTCLQKDIPRNLLNTE